MADSIIQIQEPATPNKNLDTEQIVVGANTVQRERIQITGVAATEIARIINAAPAGTEFALVVRNIPSGTQTVSVTGTPTVDVTDRVGRVLGQLTDGAAAYVAAKTGQLPAALTAGGNLKVAISESTVTVSVDEIDRATRLVGQVEGRAASGAAKAGNPNQIGGVFNTTQPTVTTGQAVEIQTTARGAVIVATGVDPLTTTPSGTQTVSGAVTANIGTTGGLALDTSVNAISLAQGATTTGQKAILVEGAVTTAAPTYTTGNSNPISLTTAGATRVDGSGVTQPVSIAAAVDVSDRIARLVGVVRGEQADNVTNPTTKVPVLPARANAAVPAWTEGNVVPLSTDLSGKARFLDYALVPSNTNVATNLTITTTTTFANVTVPSGARYVQAMMFVTGVVSGTGPTLNVAINLQEPQSANFIAWLSSPNLTATNTGTGILVGPDTPIGASASLPGVLGSTIQIQAAVGGTTPSFAGVNITLIWSS